MTKRALFIFRRDLRLEDNHALIKALEENDEVIPVFIFTPEQLEGNEYRSDNLIEFLLNTLEELDEELRSKGSRLHFFYGSTTKVLKNILHRTSVSHVYVSRDYTPFSIKRDEEIEIFCKENNLRFTSCETLLLHPVETVKKEDGSPYTVFTPYYRKAQIYPVSVPISNSHTNYSTEDIDSEDMKKLFTKILNSKNPEIALKGGRKEALELLEHIRTLRNYKNSRDIPSIDATSKLSAHNKFGTISPRELYHYAKEHMPDSEPFLRQLYWRDFFTQIAYHFPRVFGHAFDSKFENVNWENDEQKFKAWCEGRTGFPIIDAGMRELNTTGYMHNRTRMITASFLTKDLHIDWKWGEKYFAQKLIDYDPCVNNGSWQWAASTGCDAQPYFRIFNPWLQQKTFDPDCTYIKKWLPELKDLSADAIHKLEKQRPTQPIDYPKPIVEHAKEKEKALAYYKR